MKNNFQSKAVPRGTRTIWRYLSALILLFSLSIGQMWGANGDVLFNQDFNSATAVSQNLGDAAVDIDKDSENNIFGNTAASQFTSLKAAKISNAKGGLAINAKVSSNSVEYDYSKKFGFRSDDTKASFHLVKKTNFATTAPTALKIEMTMYYQQLSSGSNVTASFAIGDSFNDKEKPANANIHSGFTIKGNGTATFCQFGTTTNLTGYATKMTQGSEVEVTWVINNTGSTLKYTDPNGEESSLDNDKFDVWVGTTKNVAGAPATSASKSLQNLYIGDCDAKKKFEFYLNDIKVTDLTPCLEPSITTQPSGAGLAIGDANPELSVVASNTTSYAWKESSNGTSYDGSSTLATTASYTPNVNTAAQTKYYYCELVNSCDPSTVVKTNIVTVNVVASTVHVTGVSLDKTSQEFTLGGTTTTTLTATVAPNDATNKAVSWESSAPTKVSVTDNGDGTADIEGLAEGTATITVTTDDGSYTATCDVTVHPDPCSAWGVGTSNKAVPATVGDLSLAWVGSASTEAAFSGSSDKYPKTNSGSNYITGTLGGKVLESLTIGASTSSTGSNVNMAIAFSSSATFNSSALLEVSEGKTVHIFAVGKKSESDGSERYAITVPAGAKSFAIGRNFSFGTPDGSYQNGDSRYLYYVHTCPHICDGDDATQYAVSGTATICAGDNTNITLANSQSGAKYVLLKDAAEVDGSEKDGTGSALVWSVDATGTYTVKAIEYGDFCETAMTGSAAVTVKAATAITTQPVDADASVGIAREFSVVATGAGTLTYQWQIQEGENWTDIENADEATYSVSKAAVGDYKFRCIVSGDCGDDVTSNVVTLSVSADVLTVTYNANGGTCETSSATWTEGDDALVLPTATKANFDFIGWYDAATGGNKIASPYTPSASIELFAHYMPKLVQAIYSNTFDAFIKNQAVDVYYLQGESVPTLTSIKVLGQDAPVFEEVEGNIKVTIETVDYIFPVTKTAVAPYTGTGEKETFDGTETYVKTGYMFSTESSKLGWKFSKTDNDWSRETPGNTRIYFFLGAAEEVAFENGGTARDIKVYRNGVELATPTSSGSATITGTNTPAMYAIVSNQDDGDGALKSMTFTPWVPVTGITLKEGSTAITSKEVAQGAQFSLTAEVTPANASNPTIVWESENADIASVADGVVTGVATGGPVNIIARSQDDNSIYAACAVTVAAPCTPPTIAWDVEPADGVKGQNGSASVTTNYAAGLEVVSSDPTVASVSNDGVNITINYLKKGSAKITATVIGDGSTYCNTPVFVEKTITVSPNCPTSGNLFTWAYDPAATDITYNLTKTTSTENNDVEVVSETSVVTVSGGQAYFGTTSSSSATTVNNGVCRFRNNSSDYAKIILECPLQVGDRISFTADNTREHSFYKDNMDGTAAVTSGKQLVIDATTHVLYGAEVIYVKGSNSDSQFKTLKIDRLAPVTGVSLANATVAIGNTVTPTMTLLPSNEAYYESIAWSIVGEGEGTIANINATTGAVTALAAGTVTVQVKLNNSDLLKTTCQVEVVASFDQVDVSEATVWDVTNVSASHINLKDDFSPSKQNERLLLANVPGVNNNASFNSQALMFEGQHIGRVSNGIKHLAGRYVQFNVTVPGAVFVTFASNGSNNRTIRINDKKYGVGSDSETDYKTFAIAVEPGSVEIMGMEGSSENQYVRISKIEFKTGPAYDRTVNPAYLGTLCWKNNAVLVGATLYELAGKNASNYLVFDEVEGNALEAGKPYIFMPENGNTKIWLYNTDDAAPLTVDQDPVNHMYGTITGKTLVPGEDDHMYYFSSSHIWAVKDFAVNIAVPAYFCYVDYDAVLADEPAPAPAYGRRRVTMGVNGKDAAQGFENILGCDQPMKVMIDGTLYIIRGEKVFDATGRLVK